MSAPYLDAIRKFEGFTPKAEWDYAQHTNGYGTKARYAGEVIDQAEAERRFAQEISGARAIVEKHAPDVDEGTKAALTSLTFNAGTTWTKSGLGEAIRRGDMACARDLFMQYTKAGGEVLPGLVKRRIAEAAWIGGQAASVPTAPGAPDGVPLAALPRVTAIADQPEAVTRQAAAEAEPLLTQPQAKRSDVASASSGDEDFQFLRSQISKTSGEARMTQLLLAAKFIKSESSKEKTDDPSDRTFVDQSNV